MLPYSFAALLIFYVGSPAMLLSVAPLAVVYSAILPRESANAVLLVVLVVAHVLAAFGPREDTLALHLIVDPVTLELPAIVPFVDAAAADVVVLQFALIGALITPDEFTLPVF